MTALTVEMTGKLRIDFIWRWSDDEHISRRKIGTVDLDDELNDVVDAFLSARLVTRSEDIVVISHDALFANWQRLKERINDEKATLAIARREQPLAVQQSAVLGRGAGSVLSVPLPCRTGSGYAAEIRLRYPTAATPVPSKTSTTDAKA